MNQPLPRIIIIVTALALQMMCLPTQAQAQTKLTLSDITDTSTNNPKRYEKFEITFSIINSVATNQFFPYDESPPLGITPKIGITANAQFLPPGVTDWGQAVTVPAFYYQNFDYLVKNSRDWISPQNTYFWKVRFAPTQIGTWQYRLTAQDASGQVTSPIRSFSVATSNNKGFLRVSSADKRYFEFEDGTYFPALGYNMNYSNVSWTNPITGNQSQFSIMQQNGIQLIRVWLSQWSIFGSFWNPWHYIGNLIDYTWLTGETSYQPNDFSMYINAGPSGALNPCMSFGGWSTYLPAAEPNSDYRIRVRLKTTQMGTARDSTKPHGFVIKTHRGWLDNCQNSGTGTVDSSYLSTDSDWTIVTGNYRTGATDNFFPWLYLTMENITQGKAYVDYVWVEKDLGNGQFGPNIISKPSMSHYQYIDQRNAFAFDQMLELASQHNIYFKLVGLEKNDFIPNHTDIYTGNTLPDPTTSCSQNICFYGDRGQMNKNYWLQQAWWRYMQARWGYSTNIHSWELLNEGNPNSDLHYIMANNFASYMHQFNPNHHLVTTSLWSDFPNTRFWNNAAYASIDYADYHVYYNKEANLNYFNDTALLTYDSSMQIGAKQPGGPNKPVMRGETGLKDTAQGDAGTADVFADTEGIWLHNYVWGQINPGGLIESYWYDDSHIYNQSRAFDHRPIFGQYYQFIKDIPLNNGKYRDAQATTTNLQLRIWGQKDTDNGRAHLWIQNINHTWKNVVANTTISPQSGTISLTGFTPNTSYRIEWWNPYSGSIQSITQIVTDSVGTLTLTVANLTSDTAVRIGNYTDVPSPSPAPKPGDANGDGKVDGVDYLIWQKHYNQPGTWANGNFDGNSIIDGVDYLIWQKHYNT